MFGSLLAYSWNGNVCLIESMYHKRCFAVEAMIRAWLRDRRRTTVRRGPYGMTVFSVRAFPGQRARKRECVNEPWKMKDQVWWITFLFTGLRWWVGRSIGHLCTWAGHSTLPAPARDEFIPLLGNRSQDDQPGLHFDQIFPLSHKFVEPVGYS